MNFPVFSAEHAAVLPDIVNIMLACCLALYPDSSKKPVLQLRVKLIATIHTLKSRGTPMDLYVFCTSNMSLLRIAMIEYFVYFISSFMPNETSMLTTVFGLQQQISDIFKQFTIICDTFRHQSMQSHVLDLNDINLKAQVAIGAPPLALCSCHRCRLGGAIKPKTNTPESEQISATASARESQETPGAASARIPAPCMAQSW